MVLSKEILIKVGEIYFCLTFLERGSLCLFAGGQFSVCVC